MNAAIYPSLSGRGVFVTGGASGIGAAIVAAFADQGANVTFVDLDAEAGDAVAQTTGALFMPCDLTDVTALRAAIAQAGTTGPIRVLVNNAANDTRHSADSVTPDLWDSLMAVNLRHQFFAAQAVRDQMRLAGGGSIINLSSVFWMAGEAGAIVYSSAKAGVMGLTRSLGSEFGGDGIRVNAIAPGAVMTERQVRLWHTPETIARLVDSQALHHSITEMDIAQSALFLASDASRSITKQCLIVDAGLR